MIIDVHRHIIDRDFFSDHYWRSFARMALPILRRMGVEADIDMVVDSIMPAYFDAEGGRHIEAMDEAGIDKTVILLFDTGLIAGEGEKSIEEQNAVVYRMAEKYPERIIPFVSVDPRRKNARKLVASGLKNHGARGIKIHPGGGFNPEEKETLALAELAAEHSVPILSHTGASIPPTMSKYCDPIYLDEMLLRFPEVPVIAAHMGYGYRHQLFSLGMNRPNLYVDLAAWQTTARDRYHEFAHAVKDAVAHLGPERVLFGTDNPYLWPVLPEPAYVQAIRDLETKPEPQDRLTADEIDMILGGNARSLFKL